MRAGGFLRRMKAVAIQANIELLQQGAAVLSAVDDHSYKRPCLMFDGQRIGGHVRHIVDFYEMLLVGAVAGRVNYDARGRDRVVETDRGLAIERLQKLARRLQAVDAGALARPLAVSSEGTHGTEWMQSSLGRELEATRSHTVHHYALIAMLLRYFGLRAPEDFGVSKTTLQHRARVAEAA